MGQKTIPISLRLNKKQNWQSIWTVEKKEYPILLHLDLEIRNYLHILINRKNSPLQIIKIDFFKISKNIHVYVYTRGKGLSRKYLMPSFLSLKHFIHKNYSSYAIKFWIKNSDPSDFPFFRMKKVFRLIGKKRMTFKQKQLLYNFTFAFLTGKLNLITRYIQNLCEKKKSIKNLFMK